MQRTILVTGANGQIGSALVKELGRRYGVDKVLATDIRPPLDTNDQFELLDILDRERLIALVSKYKVGQIYHLAAILSARGEQNPKQSWDINMSGFFNVLEVAKDMKLENGIFSQFNWYSRLNDATERCTAT